MRYKKFRSCTNGGAQAQLSVRRVAALRVNTTFLMVQKSQTTRQQVDNCENAINYLGQIVIVNSK